MDTVAADAHDAVPGGVSAWVHFKPSNTGAMRAS